MTIDNNKVITIDYTLYDEQKNVLDTTQNEEPLSYIHGIGAIIPGLESALMGKTVGDEINVTVNPEDGYGVRNENLVMQVNKKEFQKAYNNDVRIGMMFQAQTGDRISLFTITEIGDESLTVDGNHPLADMTLEFDVKIVDIRDATEEELEHGHIHQGDEHCEHH